VGGDISREGISDAVLLSPDPVQIDGAKVLD